MVIHLIAIKIVVKLGPTQRVQWLTTEIPVLIMYISQGVLVTPYSHYCILKLEFKYSLCVHLVMEWLTEFIWKLHFIKDKLLLLPQVILIFTSLPEFQMIFPPLWKQDMKSWGSSFQLLIWHNEDADKALNIHHLIKVTIQAHILPTPFYGWVKIFDHWNNYETC